VADLVSKLSYKLSLAVNKKQE